jgi:hypothetical protein
MRSFIARRFLRSMSKRYSYDVSYLDYMLKASPAAFFKFARVGKASAIARSFPSKRVSPQKSSAPWRRTVAPAPSSSSTWHWKPEWRGPR